jgi:hypothetical protein
MQALSRGSFTSKLDMDDIQRFFTTRMGHGALNMIKEGKQMPWYFFESSMAQYP